MTLDLTQFHDAFFEENLSAFASDHPERVAGLVCFYPDRVDVFVDGRPAA